MNNGYARILTEQSRAQAERQAQAIVFHWAKRGYAVAASVRQLPFCQTARCQPCEVVTDLVNGLPHDYQGDRESLLVEDLYGEEAA